jgi:hypothetical protein
MSCQECPKGAKRILVGAIGIGKAMAGFDRPEVAEIQRRVSICNSCTSGSILLDKWLCPACKCLIAAKIRILSQSCPLGKW